MNSTILSEGTLEKPSDLRSVFTQLLVPCFFLVAFLMALGIAFLKVESALSWKYTSDIFVFDRYAGEIVSRYFSQDYTIFTVLVDLITVFEHLFLLNVLLLPAKILLGKYFIYCLILLVPISYFVTVCVLFYTHRTHLHADSMSIFILSLLIYLFSYRIIQGIYEQTYGYHSEAFAGFLAIAFTAFLIQYQQSSSDKQKKYQAGCSVSINILLRTEFNLCFQGHLTGDLANNFQTCE